MVVKRVVGWLMMGLFHAIQVKVIKPQLQQQVHDEVSSIMSQKQHSRRTRPKVSLDPAYVSLIAQTSLCSPISGVARIWLQDGYKISK